MILENGVFRCFSAFFRRPFDRLLRVPGRFFPANRRQRLAWTCTRSFCTNGEKKRPVWGWVFAFSFRNRPVFSTPQNRPPKSTCFPAPLAGPRAAFVEPKRRCWTSSSRAWQGLKHALPRRGKRGSRSAVLLLGFGVSFPKRGHFWTPENPPQGPLRGETGAVAGGFRSVWGAENQSLGFISLLRRVWLCFSSRRGVGKPGSVFWLLGPRFSLREVPLFRAPKSHP